MMEKKIPSIDWPVCAKLRVWAESAYQRGFQMGKASNEQIAGEDTEALKLEQEAHPTTNANVMSDEKHLERLQGMVRSLFVDYLDEWEESDSGRPFRPIHISCSRVMKTEPLGKLLEDLRDNVGLPPAKTVDEVKKEFGYEE
jgi:hypothetical protein